MARKKAKKRMDWDAVAEAERFGALAISKNHKKNLKKWQRTKNKKQKSA